MNKNQNIMILFYLILISATLAAAPLEVKRFGLFIGANDGGKGRQRLLYAGDDARKMAETMKDVGGIAEKDSRLLLDPSAGEIREELRLIAEEVSKVENIVRRTEVMFYYSGHSDENGLLIQDQQILYKEIRDELDRAGADVVIAVLDSCSSGAITRLKGGQRRSPFLIDDSSSMEGHAFLTSSSEDELSQESDRIGASFFTHYLISGLRGAADSTGDGRVTLNEIYQHTFDETLSQTESTIGGPQHPAYEIQLTGTGDLVLTDLTVPTSALQLSGELYGRFSVRNESGKLIAEFSKPEGDTLKLAIPSGVYTVQMKTSSESGLQSSIVSLNRNAHKYMTHKDFSSTSVEMTRYRGDDQPLEEGERKFVFSPVPGINYPELNDNDTVVIQGGLIGSIAPRLEGVQISWLFNVTENFSRGAQGAFCNIAESLDGLQAAGIFNIIEENLNGVQGAGIFNINAGTMQGVQGAGIFNITEDAMQGVQGAGIFNIAGMPSTGVQGAGIFNIAKEINGIQAAGIFNSASYIQGIQASMVNTADTVKGVQLGLINVSKEMHGLPIGLINISRNGIVDTGVWYEYSDSNRIYISFQSGTRYLYTLFYWGNTIQEYFQNVENMAWGVHMGSRIPLGFLEIDIDAGIKQSYQDQKRDGFDRFSGVPSARAVVALKGLGIYWGVTMDIKHPYQTESNLFEGASFTMGRNNEVEAYYRYVFGIRL